MGPRLPQRLPRDQRLHRAVQPAPDRGRTDGDSDPEGPQGHRQVPWPAKPLGDSLLVRPRQPFAFRCAHAPQRARIVVRANRAFEGKRVRHLLLRHDFRDRADQRRAQAGRRARRALPRQAGQRCEEGGARGVHVGAGAGDGRDVGFRHGHRQARCALRGLLRHASFNRELLSADRPRGARRKARRHDHAMGRARPANRPVHGGSGRRRSERPAAFQTKGARLRHAGFLQGRRHLPARSRFALLRRETP